jgi:hypothetical protein
MQVVTFPSVSVLGVTSRHGDVAVLDDEGLQAPARRAETGISGRAERKGIMSPIGQNLPRLRVDPESYETLRQQILRRDGWRCQSCGTMSNLEVHHKEFRSHSVEDSEENLITLCTTCHARVTSPLNAERRK